MTAPKLGPTEFATVPASLPDDVVAERPQAWRRDAVWTVRCLCGHLAQSHRSDMARTTPCSTGGCGCQHMRPDVILWRESRWVEGVLRSPDPA